jgi:hypothetical protein
MKQANTDPKKITKTEAPSYQATDSYLPSIFQESPRKRSFSDAEQESARQLHGLGITASNRDIDLCALVLYCAWTDEFEQHGGKDGSPMTIRQLFYRLVSLGALENSRPDYVKVSRIMTIARNDGRVDWEAIVDRSRADYAPTVWDDAAEYVETLKHGYRKDYWKMQPALVEVWVEKDAVVGSIEDLTDELGVRVRPGRGFQSTTKVHEIAELFSKVTKPIFVYYLGDHDPSGRSAEDELADRVHQHLLDLLVYMEDEPGDVDKDGASRRVGRAYAGTYASIQRLAIHPEDIRAFRLPPLKVKSTDSRAPSFRKKFGNQCVELDALPVVELRRRIRTAVEQHIDRSSWERAIAAEKAETQSILDFAERLQGLSHPSAD